MLRYAVYAAAAAVAYSAARFWAAGGVNPHSDVSMLGKTVIITGANTGIGFETARQLFSQNATVVMACRSPERCSKALDKVKQAVPASSGSVETAMLDLADFDSVRAFGKAWGTRPLHVLINNAGIMALPQHTVEASGEERQMQVNHHGHFLLTGLLLPALKASAPSRVVAVSSLISETGALNMTDLPWKAREYDLFAAYASSKLANVLHARELSRRMAAEGHAVTAVSLHPGVIATELLRNLKTAHWLVEAAIEATMTYIAAPLFKTPYEGAQTTLFAATAPARAWGTPLAQAGADEVVAGQYYADCALKIHPVLEAGDASTLGRQLWEYSEKITGWSAQQGATPEATPEATAAPKRTKKRSKGAKKAKAATGAGK